MESLRVRALLYSYYTRSFLVYVIVVKAFAEKLDDLLFPAKAFPTKRMQQGFKWLRK